MFSLTVMFRSENQLTRNDLSFSSRLRRSDAECDHDCLAALHLLSRLVYT